MADIPSSQPTHDLHFEQLEHSLEIWYEHLTNLKPHIPSHDFQKLLKRWDSMRQSFDIACLNLGMELRGMEGLIEPLPASKDLNLEELGSTLELLTIAKKTLRAMLSETEARADLLEEILNTDKPQKAKKSLERLRSIDDALQTRLLGLDAYIEQFHLAEIDGSDLLQSTTMIMGQTNRIRILTEKNIQLEIKAKDMRSWLAASKLRLDRMPIADPPTPKAMKMATLALGSESDKALLSLYTNHEKLKEAREYLEAYLSENENEGQG